MKTLSLLLTGAILLVITLSGCDKERFRPGGDENCSSRVTWQGEHFCSGVKLQAADGTWLRAFGLQGSYKKGDVLRIGYKVVTLQNECYTLAALGPEDLGQAIEVKCEKPARVCGNEQ